MSLSWFRKQPPDDLEQDPQLPPEVHEAELIPFTSEPAGPAERYELTQTRTREKYAARLRDMGEPLPLQDSRTAASSPLPMTVPWQSEPPNRAGLWFYRGLDDPDRVGWCIVLGFGGRLCIRDRRGGSAVYRSVSSLDRLWAGPIATPADLPLEALDALCD